MTRLLALLPPLALILSACAVQEGPSLPAIGEVSDTCGAAERADLLGMERAAVEAVAFDQPFRIIEPGGIVTQDFIPNRLNLYLDDADFVVRINCG